MEGVHSFGCHFNFCECFRSIANCFLSLLRNRGSKPILWYLLSRKGRICVFEFPRPTLDKVAGQSIHLGSFDLEKYSQQIFSVARESKDFFFLCSIHTWKEDDWFYWVCHDLAKIDGLSSLHSRLQEEQCVNGPPWSVLASPGIETEEIGRF